MRSVHITNYYHKNSGGISTAYDKLLEGANRRRREVRLIVPGERSHTEEVGEFGRIYYVKANFSPVFDKRYRIMMPWKTYIFDKAPIKTILRQEAPQIIEIGEKYTLSLMAGLLRKGIMNVSAERPMLVHLSCERMDDNLSAFIHNGRLSRWFSRRYMGNYAVPMFDFHLANSDYTAQEIIDSVDRARNPRRSDAMFNLCWRFLRSAQGPVAERTFVNQCGVDNVTFSAERRDPETRGRLCEKFGVPADARLLIYAGRISPEKNIGLLPEMMQALRERGEADIRLLVAGDGPSRKWLEAKCSAAAPGAVTMLGHLSDKQELADLLANCDAFVHPNPREPFGITPLEAMASGLPVVAPNSGGVLSYAKDENAWLSPPDAGQFADSVLKALAPGDVRDRKIAAGIEVAKRYTWEASTDALFDLYDRMYARFRENQHLFDYRKSPGEVDFTGRSMAA